MAEDALAADRPVREPAGEPDVRPVARAAPPPAPQAGPAAAVAVAARPRRRVCLVIDRLAGRSGGAERILIETANGLAARGHEVVIVSHEERTGPPFYPLALGVVHINLRRPRAVRNRLRRRLDTLRDRLHRRVRHHGFPTGHLLWLSKHGAFWRRLQRHLAAHEPDVAIAFLPPAITALGTVRPSAGLRRIASLHNVPERDLADPARWDPSPLDRRRRMAALGRHDAITVLLPEFRDWFVPDLRARITVMPNPVPPVPEGTPRLRRRNVVLAVGRLAPVKGFDVLIEAWARIAAEVPDWQVHVFGVGPSRDDLAAAIRTRGLRDRVRLMGHTTEIDAQYRAASIVCHPAWHEGWGLAVTEALAAGTPPVGFADCPGVNALIRHGETGLLVEPGADRAGALAAALLDLIRNPDRRAALGAAGPASVAAFAPGRVLDRWEAVLHGEDRT